MTRGGVISIPAWLLSAIGGCLAIIFGGAVTWMTSINNQLVRNSIEIVVMQTRIEHHDKGVEQLRQSVEGVGKKVDHIVDIVTELRVRSGVAISPRESPGG